MAGEAISPHFPARPERRTGAVFHCTCIPHCNPAPRPDPMSSYAPATTVKYCDHCDGIMSLETTTCPHCLAVQTTSGGPGISDKKRMPVFVLAVFLGVFGVHRFYVGKTTSAVFQLLTL